LVVPSGVALDEVKIPQLVRSLVGSGIPAPLALNVDANEMEKSFSFIGVSSCLRDVGYCVLRS